MSEASPGGHDTPLAGKTVAVPEARQLDVLAGLLERRGATVVRCPLVSIVDADAGPVTAWIERFVAAPPRVVVFYTGEGVERLLRFARDAGLEQRFLDALRVTTKVVRGPKPRRALQRAGLEVDAAASEPTTDGLIAALDRLDVAGARVAVQLYSPDQDTKLADHLRARGAEVDAVAPYVYASAADDERVAELIERLAAGGIDAIAFTSKSQVERLRAVAAARGLAETLASGLARTRVAAVGPVVAAELEASGFRVDAMPTDSYSMKPLVSSLAALLA
ncbi:MAG TPA: uroporphyrinogen-III synthase [Gammaproteobacteria bacterium]